MITTPIVRPLRRWAGLSAEQVVDLYVHERCGRPHESCVCAKASPARWTEHRDAA